MYIYSVYKLDLTSSAHGSVSVPRTNIVLNCYYTYIYMDSDNTIIACNVSNVVSCSPPPSWGGGTSMHLAPLHPEYIYIYIYTGGSHRSAPDAGEVYICIYIYIYIYTGGSHQSAPDAGACWYPHPRMEGGRKLHYSHYTR